MSIGQTRLFNLVRANPLFLKLSSSKLAVCGVVFLFYLFIVCVGLFFFNNKDLRDFALISEKFAKQSTVSPTIKYDPNYKYYQSGFDGQYVYFIAVDPINARYYTDVDSYRYGRILYPILAWVLSLGQANLVPLALILINLIAIVLGTWLIAKWCAGHGFSPWIGLIYGLYAGNVVSFVTDISDLLANMLVVLGVYLYYYHPRKIWSIAVVFSLAALARETTLIFPALYVLQMWFVKDGPAPADQPRSKRTVIIFTLILAVPILLWRGFLIIWLGVDSMVQGYSVIEHGYGPSIGPLRIPFSGLIPLFPFTPSTWLVITGVVIPGVICTVVAITILWQDRNILHILQRVEVVAMLVYAVLFALMLVPEHLTALREAGRHSLGMLLAAIFCLQYTRRKTWFYICVFLWLGTSLVATSSPTSLLIR